MTFNINHARPILDVIGKHESRGDYNTVWGGIAAKDRPANLSAMTVKQVIAWQAKIRAMGYGSTAAGKYQIIYNTLRGLGGDTSRRFDAATQDSMAMQLLSGRGFMRYLTGQRTTDDMALELAKEWASLPVPTTGRSYYAGDGLNKAHASVGEVRAALRVCKAIYHGAAIDDTRPVQKPAPAPATGKSLWAVLLDLIKSIFGGSK